MPTVKKVQVVNYEPHQMYDLVNAIEDYPKFLPWCKHTKIHYRDDSEVKATVDMAKGPLQQSFTTLNRLTKNRRIDLTYVKGPFRRLEGAWLFEPIGEGRCRLQFEITYEFANRLLSLAIEPVFFPISQSLIESFHLRAKEIYGNPAPQDAVSH